MYLYRLNKDFSYEVPGYIFKGIYGKAILVDDKNKVWGEINGRVITVFAGYASDGCSPKIKVLGKVIGVPDGPIQADGYPQTYKASLIHDILHQFQVISPLSPKQRDLLFYNMLKECGWNWAKTYYYAVRSFSLLTGK